MFSQGHDALSRKSWGRLSRFLTKVLNNRLAQRMIKDRISESLPSFRSRRTRHKRASSTDVQAWKEEGKGRPQVVREWLQLIPGRFPSGNNGSFGRRLRVQSREEAASFAGLAEWLLDREQFMRKNHHLNLATASTSA